VAGYDAWSTSYDDYDNPMIVMADRALADLLPRIRDLSVLELGCGTGRNAEALLGAGAARYVGVDSSPGMLARAKARALDARATWICANLFDDVEGIGGFDVVLFSLVLEHVEALGPALERAAKALVPGGIVRAHEIHPELRAAGTQAHFRAGEQEIALTSYPHTVTDFRAAVKGAELDLVAITDWYATPREIAQSRKLAKHVGRPVLIDVTFVKAKPKLTNAG